MIFPAILRRIGLYLLTVLLSYNNYVRQSNCTMNDWGRQMQNYWGRQNGNQLPASWDTHWLVARMCLITNQGLFFRAKARLVEVNDIVLMKNVLYKIIYLEEGMQIGWINVKKIRFWRLCARSCACKRNKRPSRRCCVDLLESINDKKNIWNIRILHFSSKDTKIQILAIIGPVTGIV